MITKDGLAGLIFVAIGGWFAWTAWNSLALGTAFRVGPGLFPLAVGLVLIGLGVVIAAPNFAGRAAPFERVPWRAFAGVAFAPIVFALTVRQVGLVPAIALCAVSAVLAGRQTGLRSSLTLIVVLTLGATLLFSFGLRVPTPLFGAVE